MNIFVIEDSELIRRRLIPRLESIPGVNVLGFADDARVAANTAAAYSPDVVLLDLQLINGNGLIVLLEIKRLNPTPIVIVLSGVMDPSIQALCRAKGADYVLDKSYEIGLIEPLLKDLLATWISIQKPAARELSVVRPLPPPVPWPSRRENPLLQEENL